MSFNSYYQTELSALRRLGRAFSARNPALAPFLGQAGSDPDVERLLEGFAFLTGRLRQKLDDELPELTHSLTQMLWPNYLRPFPAMSMVQFDASTQPGAGVLVPRNTPLKSQPVAGVTCGFRTCYTTQVLPLEISALDFAPRHDEVTLDLHLRMTAEGHLGELRLSALRLHLAGEGAVSRALYLGLLRQLVSITLVPLDAAGLPLPASNDMAIPIEHVQPVGFAEDEALMPYPLNTFRGYRYLQEYFAFPDKFLFVDLSGLDILGALPEETLRQTRGCTLRMVLASPDLQLLRPTLDNFKLYCTPVVNLFKQDAVPIRLDGKQDEYLVLPAEHDREHCSVYCVDKVTGWRPGTLGYQDYVAFESFEHDPSFDIDQARPWYSVRQRSAIDHEGLETWLGFDTFALEKHETLSVELTCTNNNLPLQIPAGGICHFAEGGPDFVEFRSIVPATRSFPPPMDRDYLWKLISNMSLNYLSLINLDALRVVLKTYDLPRYYDQQAERVSRKLLEGLRSISHQPTDRLFQGLPVRGVKTHLLVDPQDAGGEGNLFLFGSVLNEFLALYASLNSFHELHVTSTQGSVYSWTPRVGQQPLI